jgi:hypothetical protein
VPEEAGTTAPALHPGREQRTMTKEQSHGNGHARFELQVNSKETELTKRHIAQAKAIIYLWSPNLPFPELLVVTLSPSKTGPSSMEVPASSVHYASWCVFTVCSPWAQTRPKNQEGKHQAQSLLSRLLFLWAPVCPTVRVSLDPSSPLRSP